MNDKFIRYTSTNLFNLLTLLCTSILNINLNQLKNSEEKDFSK